MNGLPDNLTEKQVEKLRDYYRGYAFSLVRNRAIIHMLLETKITPDKLIALRDTDIPENITTRLHRQLNKYKRIRRIYFDRKKFDWLFLNNYNEQMSTKAIKSVLRSAFKFAKVNLNDFD